MQRTRGTTATDRGPHWSLRLPVLRWRGNYLRVRPGSARKHSRAAPDLAPSPQERRFGFTRSDRQFHGEWMQLNAGKKSFAPG